ncbi:Interferon-induced GTP-binding protein Mx [Fusarium oxysporum f. sp. cubense race 1]|uniref:Interferon-induced GTP-binding protein Mx n=1 Tax=Fusarium oxysporum f. sp. cubense (strain race 1) TaxID=1229664 RepID=N4UEL5_FUSC1|nr:Interferon-induced GTP-binding protein Mx [Fusarium oxysporum f. sp. cubense race 1]
MSQSMLTSPYRLRKIDQLRERNIATYLALPQLVAVGDQSSGKSSLLENLTGIPFPRGQELCTRYATQITHRRDVISRITIGIIPGPTAPAEHKEKLESFTKEVHSTEQLNAEFPDILNEVNTLMGTKTPRNPGGIKTFTEDVLKIERCGPDEDYLTVIDVPGIFRITTQGVTTDKDRQLVERMVKNYIRDSRTVILAVLPCNVDVATQEILAFAEEVDPTGERTLGILTKPDLLKERSAKAVVCDLVLGKRRPLTLGYYVVRSRGGDEEDSDGGADLLHRENMFKDEPWTSLPDHKTGIKALRVCLQELLGQIADKAFPKLRSETRRKLTEKQEELASLGPPRQTGRQQQQFLVSVASKFQNIVRAALDADYSTHQAFADDNLRLITEVVNTTDEFAVDFEACAHTYLFETVSKIARPIFSDSEDEEEEDIDEESSTCFDLNLYPDLEGILTKDWTSHQPSKGIMPWITQMHRRSRGVELGTFGPRVLSSAFQEQSIYWQKMATQYLSKVIFSVHKFILGALGKVCYEARILDELISGLMADLLARYQGGMNRAIHLVHIEAHKKPCTLNHYFNENLQKARNDRINKAKDTGQQVVKLDDISSVVNNQSNTQHTAEEIHDILQAYYKVARKRFVDNIYHQAVDHCLLSGPSSPLILFCEQWVLDLSDEKLQLIASESRATQERRQSLQTALQDLAQAIEILG